jgi:hypothetical protein
MEVGAICPTLSPRKASPYYPAFCAVSHRQFGEMPTLDYWQTETFLKERGMSLNYSAADLETDNATLARILAHS